MTLDEIKALSDAELNTRLEAATRHSAEDIPCKRLAEFLYSDCPPYATSLDALRPVVSKMLPELHTKYGGFLDALDIVDKLQKEVVSIMTNPRLIAEACLYALTPREV